MALVRASLVLALVLGCRWAVAQGGGLSGVTMRVLDDLDGIDAVLIELPAAGRGAEAADAEPQGEPGGEANEPADEPSEPRGPPSEAAAGEPGQRPVPPPPP